MMRKVLITMAAAASALAVAAPASAQYYPAPAPYYPAPAPRAYGYGINHARALQARVDNLQRQIGYLAQRRALSRGEYQNLRRESRDIEQRLRRNVRDGYGLSRNELVNTERQIARLEYKISRDVRDGGRYYGGNGYAPYGGYNTDRDRDGRVDRYEDDRGNWPG
jgi:TolA-binding protein